MTKFIKVVLLITILPFGSLRLFGQDNKRSLPLIIMVDGILATNGIYKGVFLVKDSLNNMVDSIAFDYVFNKATINEQDYNHLTTLNSSFKVIIKFDYYPTKPSIHSDKFHKYETSIDGAWINDVYIILKVYNYANKTNYKFFNKRTGYGIEKEIPGSGTFLSSRIRKL